MEEINLKEFFKFFISKYKLLLVFTILSIVLGYIYVNYLVTPMYHSSTTLILVSDNTNQNSTVLQSDINVNKNLVTTYSEIVKSRSVLKQVIKDLKLNMNADELSNIISVSSVENTEIIKIEVRNKDNKLARDIAKTTSSVFKKEVQKIYNLTNVSTVDKAFVQNRPYNIKPKKQLIMFFIGGLGLGTLVIFLIFYFDTTIKSSEDIEEKLGLSVIGNIALVDNKKTKGGKNK